MGRLKGWLVRQLNKVGFYTKEQYFNSIDTTFLAAKNGWDKEAWIGCLKAIERGEM